MGGNDLKRQMIFLSIAAVVVMLSFVALNFIPKPGPAPSPSPSSSTEAATPAPATTEEAQTFHGYACSPDCSELESGYGYAEANKIGDRTDCPSGSQFTQSYTQGCWAYADEHPAASQ